MRVPFEDASSETDIQLSFRTARTDGLLLLAAGSPDYCIVELRGGMVRVRLDLGSGEAVLGSPPGVTFADWNWHHIHLVRNSDEVTCARCDFRNKSRASSEIFRICIVCREMQLLECGCHFGGGTNAL